MKYRNIKIKLLILVLKKSIYNVFRKQGSFQQAVHDALRQNNHFLIIITKNNQIKTHK